MKPQFKITFIYFIISALWIYFSDRIVQQFNFPSDTITLIQTYKGWLFVIITSTFLFIMIKRSNEQLIKKEEQKREIYKTTMRGVHHIVNNFLLKVNYFKEIINENKSVKKEIIENIDKIIFETAEELKKLSNIENPSKEKIRKVVYNNTKAEY